MTISSNNIPEDSGLILAAEECPRDIFHEYHTFAKYENSIINKLMAHGPVLLRGGRGSGKSALLIESFLRLQQYHSSSVFPVYVSLRHLPLLRSSGSEYTSSFCHILSRQINHELGSVHRRSFPLARDLGSLLDALEANAQNLQRRIVLLFDDAAHIGRERPLEEFFDIFRTISTSRVSCKAAIYPGVTKFGLRFDVFNDATVVDIARDERRPGFEDIFVEVVRVRFPKLAERIRASRAITESRFAKLFGRAVTGNMRSFVYACNGMQDLESIGYPEITRCMVDLASNYFWPLLEEVAPKLGSYEPFVETSKDYSQYIFANCAKKNTSYTLVHRDIIQRTLKAFEILEYVGFIARRDASRAMKSGGRGVMYSVNLCNLLEQTPGSRLTSDLAEHWISGAEDPLEVHITNQEVARIQLPEVSADGELTVLNRPIGTLLRSNAYPYGLTEDKVNRLHEAGLETIKAVAEASDEEILDIHMIGEAHLRRIRNVVYQAIWM